MCSPNSLWKTACSRGEPVEPHLERSLTGKDYRQQEFLRFVVVWKFANQIRLRKSETPSLRVVLDFQGLKASSFMHLTAHGRSPGTIWIWTQSAFRNAAKRHVANIWRGVR